MGITEGFRQRRRLAVLLRETPKQRTLLELVPETLPQQGIAGLALDFDGVLAPHGADEPTPEAAQWLTDCCRILGAGQIVILSNRPTEERRNMLAHRFPGVQLVCGVRKKPHPDGLNKTGELTGVPLSAILMADDRLLTGCLAALLAGAVPFYVRNPFVRLRGNFRKELFFIILRGLERLYVKLIN